MLGTRGAAGLCVAGRSEVLSAGRNVGVQSTGGLATQPGTRWRCRTAARPADRRGGALAHRCGARSHGTVPTRTLPPAPWILRSRIAGRPTCLIAGPQWFAERVLATGAARVLATAADARAVAPPVPMAECSIEVCERRVFELCGTEAVPATHRECGEVLPMVGTRWRAAAVGLTGITHAAS